MHPDTQAGGQKDLRKEMETLLQEQLEVQPGDLKLQMRLARLLVENKNKEGFLERVGIVHGLIGGNVDHAAHRELKDLAVKLGVKETQFAAQAKATPHRRLGEEPEVARYFDQINKRYLEVEQNKSFLAQHDRNLIRFFNRPSSLLHARRFSAQNGGAQIAIKREDLLPPGSKVRMAVAGQVFLAAHLGYKTVVTGCDFQATGVVMAQMAARFGLTSVVFHQTQWSGQMSSNTLHIRTVGGDVKEVGRHESPRDAAVELCLKSPDKNFLVMGVEAAPEPFPRMNTGFISALGREARAQAQATFKRNPDLIVARGKSTPDAIGLFDPFLEIEATKLVCVEGKDTLVEEQSDEGRAGLQSRQFTEAQLIKADAILENSEYPSVRREHENFSHNGRVQYVRGSANQARSALKSMAQLEGLVCPIRTAYAIGWAARAAKEMPTDRLVIVNMVEPHDKNLREVAESLGITRD